MTEKFLRFPDGKLKALTLSYDDGVEQDIRLVELLDKYGVKCTFNLNSGLFAKEGTVYPEGRVHRRMTLRMAQKLFENGNHEVAVHAYSHPFLEKLPEPNVMWEIINDRKFLEEKFGTIVRGMAYPFGTYNDTVVEILNKAGIVYSRTTKSTEDFSISDDWLRLPATCHHNNPKLMTLAERFTTETPEKSPWLFYLWGHSYEFEGDKNWFVIEEFLEKVSGKDDVWYATNIEIFDYITAYNSLQFSIDGKTVHNPSATDVWFYCDFKEYCIKSGETIKL